MDSKTLTVSELASELSEKPRAIQFWTDAGVLQPLEASDRKGKGVHRRFLASEIRYGRIAKKLATLNSPISEILEITSRIRQLQSLEASKTLVESLSKVEAESKKKFEADNYLIIEECYRIATIVGLVALYDGPIDLFVSYYQKKGELRRDVNFWRSELHAKSLHAARARPGFVGLKLITFEIEELRDPLPLDPDLHANLTKIYKSAIDLASKAVEAVQLERDLVDEFDRQIAAGLIREEDLNALKDEEA